MQPKLNFDSIRVCRCPDKGLTLIWLASSLPGPTLKACTVKPFRLQARKGQQP